VRSKTGRGTKNREIRVVCHPGWRLAMRSSRALRAVAVVRSRLVIQKDVKSHTDHEGKREWNVWKREYMYPRRRRRRLEPVRFSRRFSLSFLEERFKWV